MIEPVIAVYLLASNCTPPKAKTAKNITQCLGLFSRMRSKAVASD
jgi:hypothetical protein